MVSAVNHPTVVGILIMIALLGLYMEFSQPGLGLPGLVSVICFVLVIGSKYLTGMANWIEVAVLILGIILLLIEFLILPGFGIAGILGIVCMVGGLFGMLIRNAPDQLPWPETPYDVQTLKEGALGLGIGLVGFLCLAFVLSKYLGRIPVLNGLILVPGRGVSGESVQGCSIKPEVRVGDQGRVVSPLRPAGRVRINERIVDCVAQGQFIEKGQSIEVLEVHGNRTVVRPVEG